ncbi:hypothetical protein AAMO2058_000254900 [Amorphochlora amoebiformis]
MSLNVVSSCVLATLAGVIIELGYIPPRIGRANRGHIQASSPYQKIQHTSKHQQVRGCFRLSQGLSGGGDVFGENEDVSQDVNDIPLPPGFSSSGVQKGHDEAGVTKFASSLEEELLRLSDEEEVENVPHQGIVAEDEGKDEPSWLRLSRQDAVREGENLLKSEQQIEEMQLKKAESSRSISQLLRKWEEEDKTNIVRKIEAQKTEEFSSRGKIRRNQVGPPRPPKMKFRGEAVGKEHVSEKDISKIISHTSRLQHGTNEKKDIDEYGPDTINRVMSMLEDLRGDPDLDQFFHAYEKHGKKAVEKFVEDEDFLEMVLRKFDAMVTQKQEIHRKMSKEVAENRELELQENQTESSKQAHTLAPTHSPPFAMGSRKKLGSKERLVELKREMDSAVEANDIERAERARQDLNQLQDEFIMDLQSKLQNAIKDQDFLKAHELKTLIDKLSNPQPLPNDSPPPRSPPPPTPQPTHPPTYVEGGGVGSGAPGFPMGRDGLNRPDPKEFPQGLPPPGWVPPAKRELREEKTLEEKGSGKRQSREAWLAKQLKRMDSKKARRG